LVFITVIGAFTQITEISLEAFSPPLYRALGIYIPLIAVNCAVLGVDLFAGLREYPFIPNCVYVFGSGVGWWLAIVVLAAIREKLSYSKPPLGLSPMALTFIMSGIMSLAFMGFTGINLARPSGAKPQKNVEETLSVRQS
jgi:Na+-transporting NADH:ubiquinone oxidoreductase subunit E